MSHIPGPLGPVPFERDALGYPRIEARSREEAAFAQGWLHAEDRMVQVHLQLVIARGRLMQHAGERPLFRMLDRAFRRLDLERDAAAEAAAAAPRTLAILEAYSAGWNARAATRRRPWLLRLLRIPTEVMTPATNVVLHRQVAYLGLASTQQRAEELIAELAVAGVGLRAMRMLLGAAADGLDLEALAAVRLRSAGSMLGKAAGGGSSAWAVGAGRSATGSALLACDFHLEIGKIPPYLYLSHIDLPGGEYFQGVGLPGAPTFLTGRNPDLAWGATYAYGDTVDLLVERCDRGRYLAKGEWRELRRREEIVRVRGRRRPERWVFHENEYGVIDADADVPGDYLCLRWHGARGCGSESLDGVIGIEEQRSAEAGARHLAHCRTHSIHYVLADSAGHVAYSQSGGIDVRPPGWTGAYPRPGWHDEGRSPAPLGVESKPFLLDPPGGLIVSANEAVDGPAGEQLATLPHPPYRAARLRQLLESGTKLDLRDMARAQYDTVDLGAERLLRVWGPLLPTDPAAEALVRWSLDQEGAPGDSRLALFHALHRETARALLQPLLGEESARHFVDGSELFLLFQHHVDRVLALEQPDLLDAAALAALLRQAWPASLARVARRGGVEIPLRAAFKNAFFEGKLPRAFGLDSPELDIPGSPHAAFQARLIQLEGTELLYGPVFHLLFDLGSPGGWYNFAGGASERRSGIGYGAGLADWQAGRFQPLGHPEGSPPDLQG